MAREVLGRPYDGLALLAGTGMHALGHAGLALAVGACIASLSGGLGATSPLTLGLSGLLFPASERPLAASDLALRVALLGLAMVALKVMGGVLASFAQARVVGQAGAALRLRVLEGWLADQGLRPARHGDQASATNDPPPGGVSLLTTNVRDVEVGLQVGWIGGARALAQLAPLAALLVVSSPRLSVVAVLVLVPFGWALSYARRAWRRVNAVGARRSEALLEAADEAVRHADLWTVFGAEAKARAHLAAVGRALVRHTARLEASAAGMSGANEVLGALSLVLALFAAHRGWVFAGSTSGAGAGLVPFAVVFFLMYRPLRDLAEARLALDRARAAGEGLVPLLAAGRRRRAWSPRAPAVPAEGGPEVGWLEVSDLVLARGRGTPITFRAAPGSLVAIVGSTGAGKTTLLRVLLGLEPKVAGDVRYDGSSIGMSPPGPSERPFAWVPQEAPLLAATVHANVALGLAGDDGTWREAETRALLEKLGASRLTTLQSSTRVGAGGRSLSGGERQWVSLARALASGQPVLLLDEPTSGLDAASQARVLDAIARLRGERTVIVVTHRPEPLLLADQVVRLEP